MKTLMLFFSVFAFSLGPAAFAGDGDCGGKDGDKGSLKPTQESSTVYCDGDKDDDKGA